MKQINQVIIFMRNEFQDLIRLSRCKECFNKNEECSNNVIKSHSIQNNRILNKISDNDRGMVYTFPKGNGIKLIKVGRGKATTFTGFCGHHDQSIFLPIETKDYCEGDKEQEFIFAYRAFAKEYHAKREVTKMYKEGVNGVHIPQIIHLVYECLTKTMNILEEYKIKLNIALGKKEFNIFETQLIVFDKEYMLAVSSAFDIKNNELSNNSNNIDEIKRNIFDYNLIFCTIFPQNRRTFILFTYLKEDSTAIKPIIQKIKDSCDIEQKKILSNMIAANIENLVLSPSVWNKVSELEKTVFYDLWMEHYTTKEKIFNPKNINLFIEN